jgi:transposase
VGLLCALILERRPHPEQGFRACLGILKLARSVSARRLDAAAERAIEIGALTYGSVKSIIDNRLDRPTADQATTEHSPIHHPNIRGGGYFH